jgi:predicted Zn-dependent protease
LAESAAASGNNEEAHRWAKDAMKKLPMGTPEWLRSQDIFTAPEPKEESKSGISG